MNIEEPKISFWKHKQYMQRRTNFSPPRLFLFVSLKNDLLYISVFQGANILLTDEGDIKLG